MQSGKGDEAWLKTYITVIRMTINYKYVSEVGGRKKSSPALW